MSTPGKWCPDCAAERPVGEFYVRKDRHDGLSAHCIVHTRIRHAAQRRATRAGLLALLGGKCERCGFADPRALQIDHVDGNGLQERAAQGHSPAKLREAILANPDRYMLLCANCNQIKKIEQEETVGQRVYARAVATERRKGIAPGRHPNTLAALARARTPEHQSEAGKRGSAIRWRAPSGRWEAPPTLPGSY